VVLLARSDALDASVLAGIHWNLGCRIRANLINPATARQMVAQCSTGCYASGMGTPPDRDGWLVHLRDPSNRLDPQVKLISNSVSTSEQTAASTLTGDAPGHIVVPGSGKPLRTRYAVSVTAKSATDSDALSTTLLLLGPEKGAALVIALLALALMMTLVMGISLTARFGFTSG